MYICTITGADATVQRELGGKIERRESRKERAIVIRIDTISVSIGWGEPEPPKLRARGEQPCKVGDITNIINKGEEGWVRQIGNQKKKMARSRLLGKG